MIVRTNNKACRALVDLKRDDKWVHNSIDGIYCYAAGRAFLKDDFMNNKDLVELFLRYKKLDFKLFIELMKQLNGNFAIILKDDKGILASVDRIRSIPIFYGIKEDAFLIGDDAHSIKEKLRLNKINPHAVEEFLMSGYISYDETLYYDLKQLQPGEALYFKIDKSESSENVCTERYYIYWNKNKKHLSIDELLDAYDVVLSQAFKRLVRSIEGRKVIIPLSGGVDSRLIASMFKKLNYKNVVCLSYGVSNNWETKISKKVAEKLGYDWIYVPYSRKKWHDVYRSQKWKEFFYSEDNLSSLPNINDWLAVRELKRNRSISEDAVFVPGHTGDFISGGHLHYIFGEKKDGLTKEKLLISILRKHYSLWATMLENQEIKNHIINKLSKFFENLPLNSEEDIACAYECWEWQERQAKFIINSVRTYDFWGYEWRVPLWDSEIMDFWSSVPYELKLEKKLYLSYLKERDQFHLFGEDLQRKRLQKKRFLGGRLKKFTEYFRDTSGFYGIYNYFVVTFLNMGRRNVNSILVKDYMRALENYSLRR